MFLTFNDRSVNIRNVYIYIFFSEIAVNRYFYIFVFIMKPIKLLAVFDILRAGVE